MCGIVGYIGKDEKKEIIINGLKELEYRGYDSAGIAVMSDKGKDIKYFKAVGKLDNLREKTKDFSSKGFGVAIGHTRWATHGKPTELNAHPHLGEYSFVIHNGIIENYAEIKAELEEFGVKFLSQTDTEVIVHSFEKFNNEMKDPFKAFEATIRRLKGSFAILLISKSQSDTIFFAKNAVPMIIGKDDKNEIFFSSSDAPLIGLAKTATYLEDGMYGYAKASEIKIFKDKKEIKTPFLDCSGIYSFTRNGV